MFLIESVNRDKYTELIVFSRDKTGKKSIKIVKDFRPYFYVNAEESIPEDYRITGVEQGHKDLFGKDVKKIYVQKAKDIRGVRELFEHHYEADINFQQRYIIDKIGEAEIYKLHTLSLDIETDTKQGQFPDIDEADQIITSCAITDNNGHKFKLLYKSPLCKVDIVIDENTRIFKNEEQLLESILSIVKKLDPDVITGWNVINFDLIYLINRMRRLRIDYRKLSPMNMVFANKNYKDPTKFDVTIRGRIIMDAMEAYKHFRKMSNQGKAEKYSLEFTAQDVLGKGKIEHQDDFHTLWVEKPNELITYNLRDAELVTELLEKLDIVAFYNYIRAKSFAQLTQIYQTTALVDGYLLRKAHNKFVLPSKNKKNPDKYAGAHVFPPVPGLYKNIMALDLKSLYPSIIKTFNVGFETFNPDGEIKLKEGIAFDRGVGLFASIMLELEKERKSYKKLMWKADQAGDEKTRKLNHYKQYAVKVLMNSFYGYLGYEGSRMYKKEVAEAITEWGQEILFKTEKFLKEKNYELIYGDTDSVYVKPKSDTLFTLMVEGKKLVDAINEVYIDFAKSYGSDNCSLEMEFEKIFKKLLFVGKKGGTGEGAKKKYAYILLWEDNKKVTNEVKFTGFETVRSDTPRIAKKTQTEVVELLLNDGTKEEIVTKLIRIDKEIRNGAIPTEDIAFPKGISKKITSYGGYAVDEETGKRRKIGTPPVIKGAIYANKYLGKRMSQGSKPKWLYIKTVPPGYPNTEVLSFEEEDIPKGFVIDYDTMIDKILKSKLEAILIASGFGKFPNTDARQQTL